MSESQIIQPNQEQAQDGIVELAIVVGGQGFKYIVELDEGATVQQVEADVLNDVMYCIRERRPFEIPRATPDDAITLIGMGPGMVVQVMPWATLMRLQAQQQEAMRSAQAQAALLPPQMRQRPSRRSRA